MVSEEDSCRGGRGGRGMKYELWQKNGAEERQDQEDPG